MLTSRSFRVRSAVVGAFVVAAVTLTAGALRAGPPDEYNFHDGIQGDAVPMIDQVTGAHNGFMCLSRSCSSRFCCSLYVKG